MADREKHVVRMAALGRHFQLGGIYDYLNDRFLKDSHFDWKSIDSQALIPEVNSEFQIKTTTQNSASKWENMELDQHSQATILAGLIDKYRGASNYLNEHENPKQVTYTVICRIESRTETMNLSDIADLEVEERVKPDVNPHVIVGVVYGAEIYCVLTQDLSDKTEENAKQDAENNLQEWAEKMECALEGEQLDLIDFKDQFGKDEKQQLNRMKCRVYADVHAKSFRECGFFDAYKHFLEVIEQTKSKRGTKSKAVPIVYELCPLKIIANSDAAARNPIESHEVDADLLTQCYDIWSQLESIVARAKAFVKISKKSSSLSKFVEYIERYQELVNKRVKVSILNARKSTDDDSDTADKEFEKIINIIENHSYFKPSRLERYLDIKMAEIEIIQKINSSIIPFVVTHDQLKKKLDEDFETKYALVLHIPSLDEVSNHILESMKRIENLQKLANFNDYNEEDEDDDDQEPWHMNQTKKQQVINKIREFSDHVAKNQEIENPVQFYITSKDRKKGPICQYFVYLNGEILKGNVQLPDPPTDLQVHLEKNSENTRNVKIRLEWNYKDIGYPHHFLIEYRQSGSSNSWKHQQTKEGQKQVTINCKQASMLEFRVAAETCIGRSNFSDTVDMEPASIDYGDDSDDRESTFSSVSQSTVFPRSTTNAKCKETFYNLKDSDGEEELSSVLEETHIQKEPKIKKQKVECKPPASFTDLSIKNSTYSQNSDPSIESANKRSSDAVPTTPLIEKQAQFISTILERCRKIGSRNGLDLLAVPLKKSSDTSLQIKVKRFVLDVGLPAAKKNSQHKTILIMGATGAGKTTLINAMINYIFGVEWEDNFRFQMIEEQLAGQSQAHSQTSIITAYDIHHMDGFRIPYSLTIVDTPGYGDTKGLERDEEITEMVRTFFEDKNGIQELDVVGFVAQASLPRLTPTQIYIFDSVLSIFGNDVKDNINFLLTFADSQKPPVLSAIRAANLPCPTNADGELLHHKFNNSGFFCSNQSFGGDGSASTVDKFNRFF